MISIRDPYYHELLIKFLASFSLDKKGIDYAKSGVINFRLRGKQFMMSISEFGITLGLYSPTYVESERYIDSLLYGTSTRARAFWRSHA